MGNFFTYIQYVLDFILPRDAEVTYLKNLTPDALSLLFKPSSKTHSAYVTALYSYKDVRIKKLIWHMKFKECRWVADKFGFLLARCISVDNKNQKTLLIPVPIHPKRRRERGYNQCEWLCEAIMKNIHRPSDSPTQITYRPDVTRRDVYTVKQSWSNREDRRAHIRDVFRVENISAINGANVIIIDDVCTTGATLDELRRTLLASGAISVRAFVIAH